MGPHSEAAQEFSSAPQKPEPRRFSLPIALLAALAIGAAPAPRPVPDGRCGGCRKKLWDCRCKKAPTRAGP